MAEEYYNIGPEVSNMDFYIGGTSAQAVLSIEVDLTVSATRIAISQSSGHINMTLDDGIPMVINKIAFASSSLSIDVNKTATPIEILNILIDANINVSQTVSSIKIAYASAQILIDSTLSCAPHKQTFALSNIHNDLSCLATLLRIRHISSAQSINTNCSVVPKEILLASCSISILQNILVNSPIRFSPNFVDSGSIRTLMIIDNKPITNHNRTLETSLSQIFTENTNWNNKSSRYYKRQGNASKKTFSLTWKFVPNFREKTVDGKMARDYFVQLAEDNDVHVLKMINQDENGLTPYTETQHYVFVRSYSETLIRRDLFDNVYYFDCSLTLEEA